LRSPKDLGKWPEAEAAYRQALALQEPLVAEFPAVPEYRDQLVRCHNNLAVLLATLGKRPEAEAEYRKTLTLQAQLAADFLTVPEYRQSLAMLYNNLGILLLELGKRSEAETAHRQALGLLEQLAADFHTLPDHRQELANTHNNLGNLLKDRRKRPEAEAEYRRAIALQERLAADFPTVPDYALSLGGSYCNLGTLVLAWGEAAASLDWFAKALATLRPVLAQESRLARARLFLRNVHWGRALALDRLGRHAEAVADWQQALAHNDDKAFDSWNRLRRSSSLARAGQHAQATAAVEDLLRRGNADSGTLYDAARVYALAAAQAAKQTWPSTSSLRAEQYARRSLALLRQAVQKGYKDVAHMKKDTDLDSLRQRPDFQQLLADLEAKVPGK
jgi:tetratricopeptide (TPR) repeat protein